MTASRREVACNGCTACCRNDAIILHPDEGDDPAIYQTRPLMHPVTGKPVLMLEKAPDGNCIYLDPGNGCRIHAQAPVICRSFDCARLYARFGAARLRRMAAAGTADAAVIEAGRKRLKSLGNVLPETAT